MWRTHKPNMHQPMKIHGQKLLYLLQKVNFTYPCIHLIYMFSFQINSDPLSLSEAFPYLGRAIEYNNSDWLVLFQNLKKLRRGWGVIVRVSTKTVSTMRARGMMYNAV